MQAGCTDVGAMCIWNADAGVRKACATFGGDGTTTVCRTSAAAKYKIAYEMVVYTTYGGYNPCFEEGEDGAVVDCPEVEGVYIKICNLATTKCTEKREMAWRYFFFGNREAASDGVGIITGRPYRPGTYEITHLTYTNNGCDYDPTPTTSTLILRSSCQGDEDFVLD